MTTIQQRMDALRAQHDAARPEQATDPAPEANDFHGWRVATQDARSARTVQAFGKRMGNAAWTEGIVRPFPG
ncbi:hypothetical protein [Reyranella sp. CPCC 100927]|uniref:hypothetical protein n=1 Tax=Reyranella sp. CPCC 100927 TaxID=2599616 RepID=UPI0011B622B9|nr:hypothetical protein [Reyranella sp. CPCC 100927]TWT13853.1 hypothetical protein FQU96_08065 [Reyranella sp. CPCC 100927]